MQEGFERDWQRQADQVMRAMEQWWLAHPKAKLTEMEEALDAQLGQLRARMLEDMAQASAAAYLNEQTAAGVTCPQCGAPLAGRGEHERALRTNAQQTLQLKRSYATCPGYGLGLFPG
jgi:DNA repair exonuclease SbcCD ATPase subunit